MLEIVLIAAIDSCSSSLVGSRNAGYRACDLDERSCDMARKRCNCTLGFVEFEGKQTPIGCERFREILYTAIAQVRALSPFEQTVMKAAREQGWTGAAK